MCGIAGIIGPGAKELVHAVEQMLAAMSHRGPDGKGLYTAPSGSCVLGHLRLAVLDLTETGAQPMFCGKDSGDDHFAFIYNGECYNFLELKQDLEKQGEVFTSSGDAEVVLRLLALKGAKALSLINGMYALALWDEKKAQLILARDRFGQKPLYYAHLNDKLIFASEVRALLASGLLSRTIDVKGLASYLSYGAVQGPRTIVQGVSLLPKASYLSFELSNGKERLESTWLADSANIPKQTCSPAELKELLKASVARHLLSDAPIGVFLSGGLDSSALAIAASRASASRVKTLTVTFPEFPDRFDAIHAQQIANFAATEHHEVPVTGNEILRLIPIALNALDQPTVDGLNTFIVARAASQIGLKVALSGLGGDELFGGYPSFVDLGKIALVRKYLDPLSKPFLSWLEKHLDPTDHRKAKLLDILAAPPDTLSLYLGRRRVFSSHYLKLLVPSYVASNGANGAMWTSAIDSARVQEIENSLQGYSLSDSIGLLELELYMGQMLLRDTDVMGMANSLEIRAPYLDNDFSGRVLALNHNIRKPQKKVPKWFFANAISDWLPPGHTEHSKRCFTLPFQEWMLNSLHNEVTQGIESLAKASNLFASPAVLQVWKKFQVEPTTTGWLRPWSLAVLGHYLHNAGLS